MRGTTTGCRAVYSTTFFGRIKVALTTQRLPCEGFIVRLRLVPEQIAYNEDVQALRTVACHSPSFTLPEQLQRACPKRH